MNVTTSRRIDTSAGGRREAGEVIQMLLLGELLAPSAEMWLVARNLPDMAILDNRSSAFSSIEPLWERRWLRLTEVLTWLHARGTSVTVVLDGNGENSAFRMHARAQADGAGLRLVDAEGVLEEKFAADTWMLSGPLSPGAWGNGHSLYLERAPELCAQARRQLRQRFGVS